MDVQAVKISVVIPARNRARRLPQCLRSVIDQSRPPDEIIVVDDRSADDTRQVVESFRDYGVRYELNVRKPGAQGARNHGVLVAKNDWIAFQDSDDRWRTDKLETQLEELARHAFRPNTVVHCNGMRVDESSSRKTVILTDGVEGTCHAALLLNPGPMFQGLLVHVSALSEIGLLDEDCPSFQEWDTVIRLAERNNFAYVSEPLFEWVCHKDETISRDMLRDIQGHEYVLKKHKSAILALHGKRAWRRTVTVPLVKALRHGHYQRAGELLPELALPARSLGAFLVAMRWSPRGAGRALRLLTNL